MEKQHGIIIQTQVKYLPDQSDENADRFVFSYTITITNTGLVAARLISRHWIITDAYNHVQEVKGQGVVGEQPMLQRNQSFEYTSGTVHGLITGYYEPRLSGRRAKTARFKYPLYAAPDDLLTIDLSYVYPQLKDLRLRGRLEGHRIVPYFSRADIDQGNGKLRVLFWVENPVDLFFLQIQGSGRIELADGSLIKIGYADQNGYPYVSIGKKLIEAGELKPEQASMQGIKHWGEQNPAKLPALLEQNPSYVFFRELPESLSAPLGALGVPLTDQYSIAIDPRTIPLGAPVFLSTTYPNTAEPLNRLMLAQDTGGAIRGTVRADFFWGFGDQAGSQAGRMKQRGQMWVLFPRGAEPALN